MQLLTEGLTDKEKMLLCLMGKGYTPHEIAATFDVAHDTIYSWLRTVRNKLGAKTDTQAFAMAYSAGLIE